MIRNFADLAGRPLLNAPGRAIEAAQIDPSRRHHLEKSAEPIHVSTSVLDEKAYKRYFCTFTVSQVNLTLLPNLLLNRIGSMSDVRKSCFRLRVHRGIVIAGTARDGPGPAADLSGPWRIHNGFNHQPTQAELRALHQQDVTPDLARDIDRLYDQLLSDSEFLGQHPAPGNLTDTRIGISPKKSALAAGSDAIVTQRERRKANLHQATHRGDLVAATIPRAADASRFECTES